MTTTDPTTPEQAATTVEVGIDELCGMLMAKDLKPLWKQVERLNTDTPVPATLPWLWKWSSVLPLAERAGWEVPIDRGGDRRVLALTNPGLGGLPFTSSTLWGAVQYLGPGETAPAHRHTASAIRFVFEGEGVYTTVNGVACAMKEGDLLLTPNWHWHDHTNTGDGSMAWFDGLDLPMVYELDAVFFEQYPDDRQPVVRDDTTLDPMLVPGRLPIDAPRPSSPFSSQFRYTWDDTDALLTHLAAQAEGPVVGMVYVDPLTSRDVTPTMGCEAYRVIPGRRSRTVRRAGSSVYAVYRGRGRSVIDGIVYEWEKGDMFVTPSWAAVDHEADEPSDLFAITDRPALEALSLFRQEVAETRQEVTGVFTPR
ncbi:cupin domain-containing protein [Nocardioides sp. W7]|uniref:cupin domain-containing protein n=1 Tax=Nocardioides sp. W7 TaxID=2931390 RepID=UPI001FD113BB|nr:cupin domain-containing protein [Nocardioides sp. W7]